MITIHDCIQGTPEWHALRSGLYTGSNAHKLLRYGAVEYARTEQSSFGGNFFTRRGHQLEDEAISLFETITGQHVDRPGFVTNDDFPNAGYSPDGLGADFTNEVKAFNIKRHLQLIEGDIPFEILAQIHFGLAICDKAYCNFTPYNPEFAKRELNGAPNPYYDPKKAFKIIRIDYKRSIANNFKRLLGKEAHALQTA